MFSDCFCPLVMMLSINDIFTVLFFNNIRGGDIVAEGPTFPEITTYAFKLKTGCNFTSVLNQVSAGAVLFFLPSYYQPKCSQEATIPKQL